MTIFQKKVGRTKKELVAYLEGHFRYDTANRWNCVTSYANNVKMYNLGFTEKAWEIIADDDLSAPIYEAIDDMIREFSKAHSYKYTAGFNGRNSGYLVLYPSERKALDYKSYCPVCGQRNFQEVTDANYKCGRCGARRYPLTSPEYELVVYPGRGIDSDADFEDWTVDELKDRVKLVQDFDKLCDDIVDYVKDLLDRSEIREEKETKTITVTRKVLATT